MNKLVLKCIILMKIFKFFRYTYVTEKEAPPVGVELMPLICQTSALDC